MTQIEFDMAMRDINANMNNEYKEIDALMAQNHSHQDMVRSQIEALRSVIETDKAQMHELIARKKDIARKYHEQKRQLIVDNPKAYGEPTEKGKGITMSEAHDLRRKMLKELQGMFDGIPGIDCDNINVKFVIDGEHITFETILPKSK